MQGRSVIACAGFLGTKAEQRTLCAARVMSRWCWLEMSFSGFISKIPCFIFLTLPSGLYEWRRASLCIFNITDSMLLTSDVFLFYSACASVECWAPQMTPTHILSSWLKFRVLYPDLQSFVNLRKYIFCLLRRSCVLISRVQFYPEVTPNSRSLVYELSMQWWLLRKIDSSRHVALALL
jgi:hypothetical protein